ncbi:MAG TPA: M23 family metallopeptidase, partial [Aquaticitalea sp.]|nr:M23 family metallopeptidase [Aquaticitalea sp.]
MKSYYRYILFFLSLLVLGCSEIRKVTDVVTNPSAREVYARNFDKEDALYHQWQKQLELARSNKLYLQLPSVISGQFDSVNMSAVGYTVQLEKGEELFIDALTSVDSNLIFLELYPFVNDSLVDGKPMMASEWNSKQLHYEIEYSGTYKIVIQAGLKNTGTYFYRIYTQPTLSFPVAGKDNAAIQSFWGAVREGGRRSHEGVDIFAARGTPVVASADGFVSFTGERGLGGKQVWLRNGLFGHSLYYAHLDSISVGSGKRVKLGD